LQALIVDLAGLDLAQNPVDRQLVTVELIDVVFELRIPGQHGLDLDLLPERGAQLVQRHHIEHLGDGDGEDLFRGFEGDRQHPVTAGELLGDELDGVPVDDDLGEINALLSDGPGHDVPDHCFRDEAHPHQQTPKRRLLLLLLGQRNAQLVGCDQSLLDEELAQAQLLPLLDQGYRVTRCQCAR
jgi:hypothetical protein